MGSSPRPSPPSSPGGVTAWEEEQRRSRDPHRPAFHVMPRLGWLNDPNGPIYHNGRYHLFYQHLPGPASEWDFGIVWGHAHSPDLVQWEHEEIALKPTPEGLDSAGCFSGCAAVDSDGSVVLLYTGVRLRQGAMDLPPPDQDLNLAYIESQLAAVAEDGCLRHWKKQDEPVIDLPPPQSGMPLVGWRDPFILERGDLDKGAEWVMLLGSGIRGVGGAVLVYRSLELRRGWRLDGVLCTGRPEWGHMWECPILLELPVDGQDDEACREGRQEGVKGQDEPPVHMLCISPDAPTNPVYYFLGQRGKASLTFDLDGATGPLLLDLGDTAYAPNTSLGPNGEILLWVWIQERRPPSPSLSPRSTHSYAGCMSVPRMLSLSEGKNGWRLMQRPALQVAALRLGPPLVSLEGLLVTFGHPHSLEGASSLSLDLEIRLTRPECDPAEASGLVLRSFRETDPRATCVADVTLLYQWGTGRLEVAVDGQSSPRAGGPLSHPHGRPLNLRVLIDHSIVEVFAGSGEVLTTRVYRGAVPKESSDGGLALVSLGGSTEADVKAWKMETIWGHSEWELTHDLLSNTCGWGASRASG